MSDSIKFSNYWEVNLDDAIQRVEDVELKAQLFEMHQKAKDRLSRQIDQSHRDYQDVAVALSRMAKTHGKPS